MGFWYGARSASQYTQQRMCVHACTLHLCVPCPKLPSPMDRQLDRNRMEYIMIVCLYHANLIFATLMLDGELIGDWGWLCEISRRFVGDTLGTPSPFLCRPLSLNRHTVGLVLQKRSVCLCIRPNVPSYV